MEVKHAQIIDCPSNGEKHEWIKSEHKGDYDTWGHGTMKQARCSRCGIIRYLQFNDTPIQTPDGKIVVNEDNFGELLVKSATEALEHAQGKRELKTTHRKLTDEII